MPAEAHFGARARAPPGRNRVMWPHEPAGTSAVRPRLRVRTGRFLS